MNKNKSKDSYNNIDFYDSTVIFMHLPFKQILSISQKLSEKLKWLLCPVTELAGVQHLASTTFFRA